MNLLLVSLLDIAFVLFVIVPGYAPLWPGLQGPIAWIVAVTFTSIGLTRDQTATDSTPRE